MKADYSSFRLSEIVTEDTERKYDFMALCNMHYQIFQDIYEWAGKPRVINIEKADFENVVRRFSDYMAKLWRVHPYRDKLLTQVKDLCCA